MTDDQTRQFRMPRTDPPPPRDRRELSERTLVQIAAIAAGSILVVCGIAAWLATQLF